MTFRVAVRGVDLHAVEPGLATPAPPPRRSGRSVDGSRPRSVAAATRTVRPATRARPPTAPRAADSPISASGVQCARPASKPARRQRGPRRPRRGNAHVRPAHGAIGDQVVGSLEVATVDHHVAGDLQPDAAVRPGPVQADVPLVRRAVRACETLCHRRLRQSVRQHGAAGQAQRSLQRPGLNLSHRQTLASMCACSPSLLRALHHGIRTRRRAAATGGLASPRHAALWRCAVLDEALRRGRRHDVTIGANGRRTRA